MHSTLLSQAMDLLIFGMGTVFVFLTLLVVAINLMSRFVHTFFPEPVADEHPSPTKREPSPVNQHTLAVIQAAIDLHRNNKHN